MFVSIRARLIVNVDALNMAESVGNYVKHRKVPVINPRTYTVHFVPAISGESIAHRYQEILVDEAKKRGLPVCKLCGKKRFLKSTNKQIISASFGNVPAFSSCHEVEKFIIENCVVEDIGGFLVAENLGKNIENVKRTSNFYTGYMIPVYEILEDSITEPQLHMRYALGLGELMKESQMIYYVEVASAIYRFSFDLDTQYIGKTAFEKVEELADRQRRVELACSALLQLLRELDFGAKRTRFLPVLKPESMMAAISPAAWTVPSAFTASYFEETLKKRERFGKEVKLLAYVDQLMLEDTSQYVQQTTKELLAQFYKALEEFIELLKSKGDADKLDIDKIKKEWLESFVKRRLDELANSRDLRYASCVARKYAEAKEKLEKSGVPVYTDYSEFLAALQEHIKE